MKMDINRHNYESYFILYMDNELDSEARRQVEAFVELHPDLRYELDLLVQYKLVPDSDIVFAGKEELFRTTDLATTADIDYESMLLSGIDKELSPEQEKQLEGFLATHPAQAKEYQLLQRARLVPETILFPDKAALYREETKVRRLLPVRWQRVAAAAILLLGIGITTALVINRNNHSVASSSNGLAKKENVSPVHTNDQPAPTVTTPVKESLAATTVTNDQPVPESIAPTQNPVAKNREAAKAIPERLKKVEVQDPVRKDNNEATALQNNKTNDLPKPINNPYVNNQDVMSNPIASRNPKESLPNKDPLTTSGVTNGNSQPSDIQTAAYTADVAALDQPNEKKSKNRGLFRKIARTFEKRTNIDPTDDNKLLVAGLSLRLK